MLNYKLDGNDLIELRSFCIQFITHLRIEDIKGNEETVKNIEQLLERTTYSKLEAEFKKGLLC